MFVSFASIAAVALAITTLTLASPVTVTVDVPDTVPHLVLSTALDEAADIWRSHGIHFSWRLDGLQRSALSVTFHDDPIRARTVSSATSSMIGRIVFDGRYAPEIHLRYDLAGALLWDSGGSAAVAGMTRNQRERTIGRALGRILAHELGHYLLGPRAHTPKGLMRPQWQAADLFRVHRRAADVEIDDAQKDRIATRLAVLSVPESLRAMR